MSGLESKTGAQIEEFLTDEQKKLIQESFYALVGDSKDLKIIGVKFMIRLFQTIAHAQDMFPLFKNKTYKELEASCEMRAHGAAVMYQFGAFVDNLNDLECFVALVQKVGRNHIHRGAGFTEFEEVRQMFIPFLKDNLGNQATPKVLSAWDEMLTKINSLILVE